MLYYVYEVEASITKPDRMPNWARLEHLENREPPLHVRWR